MNFAEREDSKRYCIKAKHVAIICAVVVAVGLIVGLSVGLTRSGDSSRDNGQGTTPAPSHSPPSAGPSDLPPQDQGVCPASEDESGQWKDFRLPDFINPVHYDLEIKPVLEEDTYTGSVSISINVSAPTSHLWLHLRETRITQLPVLKKPTGEQVQVRRCFEYTKQEYVVVEAEEELPPSSGDGTYLLTMEFAGWLNGSLVGFYRTTYTENGITKSIAATDHEPTDARKSFPCFDEPNKKATYNISIIHPNDYEALSNMPVEKKESVDDKWNRTTFQKSVPMSTYLVCFAVHQFGSITEQSKSGKPLTIYVQPEQKHTAVYALNITKSVFDYFEEYFAMEYTLPKLDQIAIPDFGTGAMENWGLITYRETNLLYDPNESASSNQQRVASVVTHEIVHQWFGNIVTMDWWDDLWLNEGFASFFEYLGVEHAEKEWQMRDQMLNEDVLPVQEDDSLMSSHPIVVTVTTPAEITSVFDGISYNKGASILRMLEDWITPEKFQNGCQLGIDDKAKHKKIYLARFKFKNAKTSDFWEALEEASDLPVKEVMDTWTKQMGYPVLNVHNTRNVAQKRFLLDSKANASEPHSDFGYTWNIPIKWTEDNLSDITVYNRSEKEGQNNDVYPDFDWIIMDSMTVLCFGGSEAQFHQFSLGQPILRIVIHVNQTYEKLSKNANFLTYADKAYWPSEPECSGIILKSSNPSGNAFLKINPDHIGFYRVNYEGPTWDWIAANLSLDHKGFSSADRASLIDDAFALARAQLLDYKKALNLTTYLKMEKDFLPWQRVISAITYIISMFEDDTELYPLIESYFQDQVKPIADSLGWNDTGDHITKLLRASVLGLACKTGDREALNNASQLFEQWLSGTVSLPVNLRLLVYRYGMQNSGNETSWYYTLEQYQKTSLAQEKEKLLYGLASVKNVTLLSRYLDFLKNSTLIKSQDVFTVIRYISYNSYGKTMAWNWIQLNWEYLVNRYTLNDRNLGRIVTIAEPFNTELQLWQMESFFAKYPEAGAGETPREQVLETVKNNIEWLKQNRNTIREWFFDLPRNG